MTLNKVGIMHAAIFSKHLFEILLFSINLFISIKLLCELVGSFKNTTSLKRSLHLKMIIDGFFVLVIGFFRRTVLQHFTEFCYFHYFCLINKCVLDYLSTKQVKPRFVSTCFVSELVGR